MRLTPQQELLREHLGLVRWRLQQSAVLPQASLTQESAAMAADAEVSVSIATTAVPIADDAPQAVRPSDESREEATSVGSAAALASADASQTYAQPAPCRMIWGGPEDPTRQRLQADLVQLLERHGIGWESFQEQAGYPLPEAPCVCFVLTDGTPHQDPQGRLLLPRQPGLVPALSWKPLLWAYLQGIFQ